MEDIADCSHETFIIDQNYIFKWTLKNLSKLDFAIVLNSCAFYIDMIDSKWHASFTYNSDSTATLKLIRNSSTTGTRISFEAKILDCNNVKYYESKVGSKYYNTNSELTVNFSNIRENILKDLKMAPNDMCIITFYIKSFKFKKGSQYETPSQEVCEEKARNSFCSNFWKMFQNKTGTDVTLQVQGDTIEAHKFVLSAQSPVFAKMFEVPMTESAKNSVIIDDISKAAMTELINFMYSKAGYGYSFETALELYYAADKYEVFELREICGKILVSRLSEDNAGMLLEMFDKHKDDELKTFVKTFINCKIKSCIKKDWMHELIREQNDLVVELMSFIK